MDREIRGKSALVTGGSHGIGLATAHALAREGCHVAICARDKNRLTQAVQALKSEGGQALGISADILVTTEPERVIKEIVRTWGTLHILVNNVGGGGRWGKASIEETPEEVWTDVYTKNAMAAVRFTRLTLSLMRKQHWGR